jgi:hypothetical protein
VVRGQGAGQSVAQETPCASWDWEGGFEFKDLTPGVEMTIQVSAPGYAVLERTVVPSAGPKASVDVIVFAPSKQ